MLHIDFYPKPLIHVSQLSYHGRSFEDEVIVIHVDADNNNQNLWMPNYSLTVQTRKRLSFRVTIMYFLILPTYQDYSAKL